MQNQSKYKCDCLTSDFFFGSGGGYEWEGAFLGLCLLLFQNFETPRAKQSKKKLRFLRVTLPLGG